MERPRQFKMRLSHDEWDALLGVAEFEDMSGADVLRTFITRRYDEIMQPRAGDWHVAADALFAIAGRLRTLAAYRR